MIAEIDVLLTAWAEEHRRREATGPGGVRCPIGALMDNKGVLARSSKRSVVLGDALFPVTDLLVNGLRYDLQCLVHEHYRLNPMSTPAQKAAALGYGGTSSYYRALDTAHRAIRAALSERRVA